MRGSLLSDLTNACCHNTGFATEPDFSGNRPPPPEPTWRCLVREKSPVELRCVSLSLVALFGQIAYPVAQLVSEHLEADGATMLEHSCRLGLEGIISKRRDLAYRSGRGDDWFKAKCQQSQEFVILGYVASTAATRTIGALALGYYCNGQLAYAGRVGTGWSAQVATSLYGELDKIKAAKPPLRNALPAGAEKGVVWTQPRLVCAVEYRDWTHDGLIRQSSFKGLREDKPAQEISLESPRILPSRRAPVASISRSAKSRAFSVTASNFSAYARSWARSSTEILRSTNSPPP